MCDITVTTPSMPSRARLLTDAIASVSAQTVAPTAHLIRVQEPPGGLMSAAHLSHQRNQLLRGVQSEWVALLDDDDVYLPYHFEAIGPMLEEDSVDVVYTFARVGCVAREDVSGWSVEQLLGRLQVGNCISSNAAIRTRTLWSIGGWDEATFDPVSGRFASGATFDDWDLWIRLARHGATFACVPVETWDYRSGDWQQVSR